MHDHFAVPVVAQHAALSSTGNKRFLGNGLSVQRSLDSVLCLNLDPHLRGYTTRF